MCKRHQIYSFGDDRRLLLDDGTKSWTQSRSLLFRSAAVVDPFLLITQHCPIRWQNRKPHTRTTTTTTTTGNPRRQPDITYLHINQKRGAFVPAGPVACCFWAFGGRTVAKGPVPLRGPHLTVSVLQVAAPVRNESSQKLLIPKQNHEKLTTAFVRSGVGCSNRAKCSRLDWSQPTGRQRR